MLALNVWLTACAALWAGARGEEMVYDALTFLYDVVKDDEYWMRYLDVKVNVDPTVVSAAARSVLQDMHLVPPASVAHRPATAPPNPEPVDTSRPSASGGDEGPESSSSSTVSAKALRLIVNAVTKHNREGDAIEFGMSVLASAVTCNVLPYVMVQLKAIEQMTGKEDPNNYHRPQAVWKNLVLYMDKMARLKDSLRTVADMYHRWGVVVGQTFEPTLDSVTGAVGDVGPFKELVKNSMDELCDAGAVDQTIARMNFDPAVENWKTAEGVHAIFQKCENDLRELFDHLPFITMDMTLWSDYLNNPQLIETPKNVFVLV